MMKRGSFGSGRVGSGRVGSGRVGSGRVNAVLYPSRPKPHSFSVRPDYRAVYCALRLLAERLKQAVLSLDELSKKKA